MFRRKHPEVGPPGLTYLLPVPENIYSIRVLYGTLHPVNNVIYKRVVNTSERLTFRYATRLSQSQYTMSTNSSLQSLHQEGRILLAIQAIKRGHIRSILAAAKSYNIHYTTFYTYLKGYSA